MLLVAGARNIHQHTPFDRVAHSKNNHKNSFGPYFFYKLDLFMAIFQRAFFTTSLFLYIEGNPFAPCSLPVSSEQFVAFNCSVPVMQFVPPHFGDSD